jgi:hypothetical protein
MTSLRQIESNRRNAQRSTGPKTPSGKARASQNAVRHGLTAETVIGPLEDPADVFELAVMTRSDAETAFEREPAVALQTCDPGRDRPAPEARGERLARSGVLHITRRSVRGCRHLPVRAGF